VGSSSTSQLGPAAGASAALAMEGMPGSGGLRRMQHLELNGSHLMSSAVSALAAFSVAALCSVSNARCGNLCARCGSSAKVAAPPRN
jgi:hypothetical protein